MLLLRFSISAFPHPTHVWSLSIFLWHFCDCCHSYDFSKKKVEKEKNCEQHLIFLYWASSLDALFIVSSLCISKLFLPHVWDFRWYRCPFSCACPDFRLLYESSAGIKVSSTLGMRRLSPSVSDFRWRIWNFLPIFGISAGKGVFYPATAHSFRVSVRVPAGSGVLCSANAQSFAPLFEILSCPLFWACARSHSPYVWNSCRCPWQPFALIWDFRQYMSSLSSYAAFRPCLRFAPMQFFSVLLTRSLSLFEIPTVQL